MVSLVVGVSAEKQQGAGQPGWHRAGAPAHASLPAPYVRIASSSTNQNNLAGGQSDGIQIGIRNVDSEIL